VPIGDWVMRQACAEAMQWPSSVRIAVNVSPIQFIAPSFVASLVRTLADTGLAPDRLEVEITEGVFLSAGEANETVFNALKATGVRLALDDFGTGYSSLGYLQNAPFNKLKIDQSFVRGAANGNHKNASILRAIIALADSLGMDTTAEGVESHDDLMLVRELGCSQVQGYIFGRPMAADAALELANSTGAVAAEGFLTQREPRHRLLRRGSLQWNGMTFPIRLKNISTGGALIESERMVPEGSIVQLDLSEVGNFGAEVRWTRDNHLGIKFDEPFKRSRLVPMQNEAPAKQAVLKPDYLATESNPSSPWAGRSERLTVDKLMKGRG
jgi:EAL domain-containing protein (putative c-di-GMP-specific phosphodiesterase class I)